jgi:zinc protease
VRDAYGKLSASSIPPEDCEPEPPQRDVREVELKKPTATEKLFVGYHGPAMGDGDHATLTILSEILFGGRASRVHRSLIIEKEIASEIRGWVATFVTAREGHGARDVLAALDRELDHVRRDVVTDDELVRAKARLELSTLQSLESTSGKAEVIGFNDVLLGDPCAVFRRLEAYRRVTASDVRKAARRYLRDGARTIVRVVPDGEEDDELEEAAQ